MDRNIILATEKWQFFNIWKVGSLLIMSLCLLSQNVFDGYLLQWDKMAYLWSQGWIKNTKPQARSIMEEESLLRDCYYEYWFVLAPPPSSHPPFWWILLELQITACIWDLSDVSTKPYCVAPCLSFLDRTILMGVTTVDLVLKCRTAFWWLCAKLLLLLHKCEGVTIVCTKPSNCIVRFLQCIFYMEPCPSYFYCDIILDVWTFFVCERACSLTLWLLNVIFVAIIATPCHWMA